MFGTNTARKARIMSVKLRSRKFKYGTSFFLEYSQEGKRIRKTLDIPKNLPYSERKRIAQKMRLEKEISLSQDKSLFTSILLVEQLFDIYIKQYRKKDIRKIKSSCKAFMKAVVDDNHLYVNQITILECKRFKDYISDEYTIDTAQSYFKSINKIFKYAVEGRYISSNPFDSLSNIKGRNTFDKDFPTKSDIEALSNAECPNDQVKKAYLFCCNTGLGNTDCRILKYDHIKDRRITGIRGKGRSQEVPLNRKAIEIISPLDQKGFVFDLPSDSMLSKAMKSWCLNAGINKHLTFYSARHGFASNLIENGVDLETVRLLLGHSSYKYIMRYVHRSNKAKQDAVDRL